MGVVAEHGEGLARARHPVGEARQIVALQQKGHPRLHLVHKPGALTVSWKVPRVVALRAKTPLKA